MTVSTSTCRCILALAFALGPLAAAPAGAAIFYVGIGTGCTHANVALAVAAAAANGPDLDIVRIASPALFLAGLVEVNDQSVQLVGGFPNCTTSAPTGRTQLNQINAATDAFWVHGANPDERFFGLTNIDIVLGASAGRGLLLQDTENALLDNSTVEGGHAVYGGNLRMQGPVFLQLVNGSQVLTGTASGSGGGIHCENGGDLYIDTYSGVESNVAEQNGGGIFGFGCTIASSGRLFRNRATARGGGIYAAGASTVQLTGGNPGFLSEVRENHADEYGGGLFLVDAGTTAVARNAMISGNYAPFAGGVWVGIGGTSFTMDVDPATCSVGRRCSYLTDNYSFDGTGGALLVAGGSFATVRQTTIRGNHTQNGDAATVASVIGTLLIESCEIFDNVEVIDASRFYVTGTLTVALSTIVEPTTSAADVFWVWSGSSFKLLSSIVQALYTFHAPPVAANIDCVITREQGSFPAGGTFLTTVTDPTTLFMNSAAHDYRLKRNSVAQDYCDNGFYNPTDGDIENQARGYDDPTEANLIGPYDLGADEWRPDLFLDGFETGNTLRWSNAAP